MFISTKEKRTWALKFHINLKGNCMESYVKKRKKKKEDIGILHDKQAFTIFLHSLEKHNILYCNLASTVKGNMFYSG